jgi:anti-sigma factor RsiW
MNHDDCKPIPPSELLSEPACSEVTARLGDYVDNELDPSVKLSIDTHLDICPECAAFFASYKHVIDSAAELREPEAPLAVDVQNRLRAALNQRLGLNLPYIA